MTVTEIARLVDLHVEARRQRLQKIAALAPTSHELMLVRKGEAAIAAALERYRHDLSLAMCRRGEQS